MAHAAPIDITMPEVGESGGTIPVFARWFGSWKISVQRRALSPAELSLAYDREAAGWDRTIHRLGFDEAYAAMLRRALPEALTAGDREPLQVLDAGMGTGELSVALSKAKADPIAFHGIDISPGMLNEADCHLRDRGIEADLRLGDVQDLPYEDGAFDLVMAAHVLEHLADPQRALAEMVRVLKPGGMLLACLTRRSSLGMYIHLKWRTHRVTAGDAEGWFARHGLEHIRCLPFEGHTRCRNLSLACIGRKPLT
jgi:demethylmenaquinone methyltransferase/2-methoxy-6-polyprenyl-1,4-benzoquinol methylase